MATIYYVCHLYIMCTDIYITVNYQGTFGRANTYTRDCRPLDRTYICTYIYVIACYKCQVLWEGCLQLKYSLCNNFEWEFLTITYTQCITSSLQFDWDLRNTHCLKSPAAFMIELLESFKSTLKARLKWAFESYVLLKI